jgi:hypothetical protein
MTGRAEGDESNETGYSLLPNGESQGKIKFIRNTLVPRNAEVSVNPLQRHALH